MQLPNHTQIPNEFIALMAECTGAEVKVFLAICRKTIGWQKVTDRISYSQLTEMTGLSTNGLKGAIAALKGKGLITQHKTTLGFVYDIGFVAVSESDTPLSLSDTVAVSESDTTKERRKETTQKTNTCAVAQSVEKTLFTKVKDYIFAKHREFLGRSIRFAWWSGHEQGAFAGSTWYLDNFWDDIRDNAVAYITMDGLGRIGSSGYECRNTEEVRNFHEKVVKEALGIQVRSNRIPKTGDQSFHGMGLPAFTGKQDLKVEPEGDMFTEAIWYSHSALDTTDNLDIGLLKNPFKVNSLSLLRLCNSRILPFEFVTLTEAIHNALTHLQKGKPMIDLTPLINNSSKLVKNAVQLKAVVEKEQTDVGNEQRDNRINTGLMMLSRILIPIFSSKRGKYSQDPRETHFKPLPVLQSIQELSALDPNSQETKALFTFLVRQRNKVSDAIQAANQIITDTLNSL